MRILYTLLLAIGLGITAQAQTIDFTFEAHDFGQVQEGDTVSIDFVFTNNGPTDLILMDVATTCGCTTPYWPKDPIPPGGTDKITATFDTNGKGGKFNKPLTITSNATNAPVKRIFLKGEVLTDGE